MLINKLLELAQAFKLKINFVYIVFFRIKKINLLRENKERQNRIESREARAETRFVLNLAEKFYLSTNLVSALCSRLCKGGF